MSPFEQRIVSLLEGVLVAWLLFAGMWSGPAVGATLVYPNGMLAAEAALAVLLVLQGRRRAYPFLWPCVGALAIVLLATLARSVFLGYPFAWMSLWILAEPMARGMLIFLVLVDRPRGERLAWGAMLAGLGVLALATIIQHATGVTRWYVDLDGGWASGIKAIPYYPKWAMPRAQGLTSYINLTAALLAGALPLWLLPALRGRAIAPWARGLLVLGGLATAAALWYTGSRGPIIAVAVVGCLLLTSFSPAWGVSAVVALLLMVAAAWPALGWVALGALAAAIALAVAMKAWRLRYLLPVALALALVGGVQVMDAYVWHSPLNWRIANEGVADAARLRIYAEGIRTVALSPWCGVGDARAAVEVLRAQTRENVPLPRTQRNFHNQPLQWAAAQGIPAALALSLLVLWVPWVLWRRACRERHILGMAIAAALAIFLLTNLAEAHFWRIEGGGFFWSLVGVGAALLGRKEQL
jgi:O-antigen ligase